MFNVSGPELLIVLLLALVVLGPDKLPEAARKIGRVLAEVRRISNGFQAELRDAMHEPLKATQETMDLARGGLTDTAKPAPVTPAEAEAATPEAPSDAGAPPDAQAPPDPDPVVIDEAAAHSLEALAARGLGMIPDPAAPGVEPVEPPSSVEAPSALVADEPARTNGADPVGPVLEADPGAPAPRRAGRRSRTRRRGARRAPRRRGLRRPPGVIPW